MTCFEHELTEWVALFMEETDKSIDPTLEEFYDWWTDQREKGRTIKYFWEKEEEDDEY